MVNECFECEDGGISVTGVFWTMILLAMGGLAIDASNAFMSKNRLAATADAAALAAARELPDEDLARATALEYIEKNMPASIHGTLVSAVDVQIGSWDAGDRTFFVGTAEPNGVRVVARHSDQEEYGSAVDLLVLDLFGGRDWNMATQSISVNSQGCVSSTALLGGLTDYLFFFENASSDGNWQGATKGFVGDVAVNGIVAKERTSGGVPYRGTIFTNDSSIGAWQDIVDQNSSTASSVTKEVNRIKKLQSDLNYAFGEINAMVPTPGFEAMSSKDLDGLNTQDGIGETIVINVTSDLSNNKPINITGDADDLFVMRWDEDPATPEYEGQVKFSGGGGINPLGGLKPGNFIHVAGDLNASGGGSNPSGLAPYLADLPEAANGGGFFTGYWLTTGKPGSHESSSLSNGIFVGGWYTIATKFSMTSGTSGVHVAAAEVDLLAGCTEDETVVGSILVD